MFLLPTTLFLLACASAEPAPGACEMRYTALNPDGSDIGFCTIQEAPTCLWAQESHGDANLGFHPDTPCEDVGYTVCCTTSGPSIWFADEAEADVAREAISGEGCVPCEGSRS